MISNRKSAFLQECLRYGIALFGNGIVNYLCYINLTCFDITFELWKICKKHTQQLRIYHGICIPVRILVHKYYYWLACSLVPASQRHTHPRSEGKYQWFVNFSDIIMYNFMIFVKEIWTKFEENLSISEGNFGLKWEKSEWKEEILSRLSGNTALTISRYFEYECHEWQIRVIGNATRQSWSNLRAFTSVLWVARLNQLN